MKKKLLSLILSLICFGLIALPIGNYETSVQPLSLIEETHTNN